jgi:hypothetical protein
LEAAGDGLESVEDIVDQHAHCIDQSVFCDRQHFRTEPRVHPLWRQPLLPGEIESRLGKNTFKRGPLLDQKPCTETHWSCSVKDAANFGYQRKGGFGQSQGFSEKRIAVLDDEAAGFVGDKHSRSFEKNLASP